MKVCVVQPYYSFNYDDLDECYNEMMALVDKCDDSLDVIVMPEYCDIPVSTPSEKEFKASIEKYNARVYKKVVETAKRCNAVVFANFAYESENGYRNTTYAFNQRGEVVGKYFKAHPAPSEVKTAKEGGNELDVGYSYEHTSPYIIDVDGVRYGFMTCYDFYFYESFAPLALAGVDVIIGCSHQRTDTHQTLETIGKFLSYHTNAYLVRSAVSLGEESGICGCSMVVAPNGTMLLDMKSKIGLGIVEIDPHKKHFKPAGFLGKDKAHYEYIEEGRRPWLYRNGGSGVALFNDIMPYPRVCAHRGFSTVAPENSLPSLGSAVGLGAEEIEFDIWSTKDGVLVSCHDDTLDRVSDGTGKIYDHTYEELLRLDFGVKHGERFRGLKIPTFEEILRRFGARTIMNIHVKIWDVNAPDPMIEQIVALVRKHDCARHVYFMTTNDNIIKKVMEYAPDIAVCVGWDGNPDPMSMPSRAIKLGAKKIQLFKPYFNAQTVKYAHENGILCNVFWSDDPAETEEFLEMGIDTILANDYLSIANTVKKWKEKR